MTVEKSELFFMYTNNRYYMRIDWEEPVKVCFNGLYELLRALFPDLSDDTWEELGDFQIILSNKSIRGQSQKSKFNTTVTKVDGKKELVPYTGCLYSRVNSDFTSQKYFYHYAGDTFYEKVKNPDQLICGKVDVLPLIKAHFDYNFFWDKTYVYMVTE